MKTIYLSGPIMDEHEGEARKWRDIAESLLSSHFRLLDPMRRNFRKCSMLATVSENSWLPSPLFRLKTATHG